MILEAKPFISVLIDTYNHERFIERASVSVLEQDIGGGSYVFDLENFSAFRATN
jgi:hypothetical protein